MLIKKTRWLALLLVAMTACGYQVTGLKSTNLPQHIHTLAIPVFENTSAEPTVQRSFTEVLRRSFINDGRLRTFLVGKRRLISFEAATEWRRNREEETAGRAA